MPSKSPREFTSVSFWGDVSHDIDLRDIELSAMSVKGATSPRPLRFLEVFQETLPAELGHMRPYFMPRVPGVDFRIGDGAPQPPYRWKECDARTLAVNFTYNSSAVHRILTTLVAEGRVGSDRLRGLEDRVFMLLASIYKDRDALVMRNMNNNISMYLVPKAIELVLGRSTYDSERQDVAATDVALRDSLGHTHEYMSADILDLMGIAVAKGVSFIDPDSARLADLESIHPYYQRRLAIDHRKVFLDLVEDIGANRGSFSLVAVLDDTAESVDDLLWILRLMEHYPFVRVAVLVNRIRVSVNLSADMLSQMLASPQLSPLAPLLGKRLSWIPVYCPFFAFQPNTMQSRVLEILDRADVVYVKGANFFETFQLPQCETFYAFVVAGPISLKYTGLQTGEAVFAHVPRGMAGYVHKPPPHGVETLVDIVGASHH